MLCNPQCPDGFWAAANQMSPCEQCPPCRFTDYVPGDGTQQASIQHCKVSPGCGTDTATPPSDNSTDVPSANECPVGFYGPGDAAGVNTTANPGCVKCPAGQSTSAAGSAACDGEHKRTEPRRSSALQLMKGTADMSRSRCACIVRQWMSQQQNRPQCYSPAAVCCLSYAAAAVCAAGSGIQDGSDNVASCSACVLAAPTQQARAKPAAPAQQHRCEWHGLKRCI
jgi:hypothetical protein